MHHLAHAGPPRCLGQSDGAHHVDRRVELRIGHRTAHVNLGGEVVDHLGGDLGQQPDQIRVDDIGLDQLEPI